jgi:hypothetical protein
MRQQTDPTITHHASRITYHLPWSRFAFAPDGAVLPRAVTTRNQLDLGMHREVSSAPPGRDRRQGVRILDLSPELARFCATDRSGARPPGR